MKKKKQSSLDFTKRKDTRKRLHCDKVAQKGGRIHKRGRDHKTQVIQIGAQQVIGAEGNTQGRNRSF